MFLFKDGLCHLINRLSFSSGKNILFSRLRILKSSYDAERFQISNVYGAIVSLTCFLVSGDIPVRSPILKINWIDCRIHAENCKLHQT